MDTKSTFKGRIISIQPRIRLMRSFDEASHTSVSYTHLDVYKRQLMKWSEMPGSLSRTISRFYTLFYSGVVKISQFSQEKNRSKGGVVEWIN